MSSEADRAAPESRGSRWATAAALSCSVVAALLVRSAKLPLVLLADGRVLFAAGDAWYHARRALFSFEQFPAMLLFDSYVNHPAGAWVPFPPLYDLALAAFARALGRALAFETALAWAPVVLGSLTALPVYATARRLGGRGAGLGAAALLALLPIHVRYSELGNPDHHAAVTLFGAALLALAVELLTSAREARGRRLLAFAALALVNWLLLVTWQGSLLYLATAAGLLGCAALVWGRAELLWGGAGSALLTLLLTAPVVGVLGPHPSGPYSTVELSRFHLLFLAAQAGVFAGLAAWERVRPARSAVARLARGAALVSGVAAISWAGLPGLREGLASAGEWLGQRNTWGARSAEQLPLFGRTIFPAESLYGYLAFLVPLAPLAALARARVPRLRAAACLLAGWTLLFGLLALGQVRYGNDFAPAGCVAFALGLAELAALAQRRLRLPRAASGALAVGLGAALLAPVLDDHLAQLRRSAPLLRNRPVLEDLLRFHPTASLVEFAEQVREATPETAGYLEAGVTPEYGILCPPNIGHVLHYVARRATPADNFGPWAGAENFRSVQGFFGLDSERAAIQLAKRLHTPYVVTMQYGESAPRTLMHRLQRDDGLTSENGGRLRHFRLVTEGPRDGAPLELAVGLEPTGEGAPYKLFEVVRGALLEVRAPAGSPVSAEVRVRTPAGRSFVYRAEAVAGPEGLARLRVPYATQTQAPARPVAPYRVRTAERTLAVAVTDAQVRSGARLRIDGGGE